MAKILTGVIGHPIGHSKSPLIHNHWIEHYRLDGQYTAHDIAPENLESGVKDLIDRGYKGFNVTVPHKRAVMQLCDQLDDTAKQIGAVNTVKIKNGRLYGQNTDAYGFTESILHVDPNFDFTAGKAVMLGAGGAARAVLHALNRARAPEIIILNRTKEKAEELAENCSRPHRVQVLDWDKRHDALDGANLLVNTTSLGMEGQPPLELHTNLLPKEAMVADIVYAPLHTDLIADAIRRKNPYVLGTGMLLHQARLAFQEWYGVLPGVTLELEEKVIGKQAA